MECKQGLDFRLAGKFFLPENLVSKVTSTHLPNGKKVITLSEDELGGLIRTSCEKLREIREKRRATEYNLPFVGRDTQTDSRKFRIFLNDLAAERNAKLLKNKRNRARLKKKKREARRRVREARKRQRGS
jgi:hypothetical protein